MYFFMLAKNFYKYGFPYVVVSTCSFLHLKFSVVGRFLLEVSWVVVTQLTLTDQSNFNICQTSKDMIEMVRMIWINPRIVSTISKIFSSFVRLFYWFFLIWSVLICFNICNCIRDLTLICISMHFQLFVSVACLPGSPERVGGKSLRSSVNAQNGDVV